MGSSCHVTSAPYSCERGGRITQLQYLLQLLRQLRRIPKRRSSQNYYSPTLGEKGPVGREEGVSVPDRIIASIVHGRPAGALIGICILMYSPIPLICT